MDEGVRTPVVWGEGVRTPVVWGEGVRTPVVWVREYGEMCEV